MTTSTVVYPSDSWASCIFKRTELGHTILAVCGNISE